MLNDNGVSYEILEVVEYNEIDKKYYENSWQKQALALIKGSETHFVVAHHVGETSWGSGNYFNTEAGARKYFKKCKEEYLKG